MVCDPAARQCDRLAKSPNAAGRLYRPAAIAPIPLLEAEAVERKTISIMKACELVGVAAPDAGFEAAIA